MYPQLQHATLAAASKVSLTHIYTGNSADSATLIVNITETLHSRLQRGKDARGSSRGGEQGLCGEVKAIAAAARVL